MDNQNEMARMGMTFPPMNPALKRAIKIIIFGALGGGIAASIGLLNSSPLVFGSWTTIIASVLGFIEKSIPNNF